MRSAKEVFRVCFYEFRIQLTSARVWLGYLTGIVIILSQTSGYLAYADHYDEPVNVLEAFLIVGNNANTVMFLVLGWLLVLSSAPFVDQNSLYLIYRTKKKLWNSAMVLYVILQSVIYYIILMLTTVIISARNGFLANIWSKPLMRLTSGGSSFKFDVYFPYAEFVHKFSVFEGVFQTWLLLLAYGLTLGLFLYAFSLFSGKLTGVVVTFLFHFLGYEVMKEGFGLIIRYSLLARTILVSQVGSSADAQLFDTYILFFTLIILLIYLSGVLIKYVDFQEATGGE